MREVTFEPSRPASGESLTTKLIARVGGSTGVDGSGDLDLGRADRVGDGGLGKPGDGDDVARLGLLDRPTIEAAEGQELRQPRGLDHLAVARQRLHRHVHLGDAAMDAAGQHAAEIGIVLQRRHQHGERRVRIGDRRMHVLEDQIEERDQILALVLEVGDSPAGAARGIKRRKIELVVIGVERGEQIENLVMHLDRARIAAIDLVDDDDRAQALAQRLADHEFGLRHRPFGGIDQHQNAIDHREDALDLAAEIGMAGRVDDVDARLLPLHRGAFGENGDAALALEIVRIERALHHLLIGAESAALAQKLIDKRGLAMIDMRDDGDIANIHVCFS